MTCIWLKRILVETIENIFVGAGGNSPKIKNQTPTVFERKKVTSLPGGGGVCCIPRFQTNILQNNEF